MPRDILEEGRKTASSCRPDERAPDGREASNFYIGVTSLAYRHEHGLPDYVDHALVALIDAAARWAGETFHRTGLESKKEDPPTDYAAQKNKPPPLSESLLAELKSLLRERFDREFAQHVERYHAD